LGKATVCGSTSRTVAPGIPTSCAAWPKDPRISFSWCATCFGARSGWNIGGEKGVQYRYEVLGLSRGEAGCGGRHPARPLGADPVHPLEAGDPPGLAARSFFA